MQSRVITARYPSRCKGCSGDVEPGDKVHYRKGGGVRCTKCGPHEEPRVKATPKPPAGQASASAAKAGRPAEKCSDGVWRYEFGSVGEAVIDAQADYAQNEGNRKFIRRRLAEHGVFAGRGDTWTNRHSYQSLAKALREPPRQIIDAVEQMREQLTREVAPPRQARRRKRRNQEWGDELMPEQVLMRSLNPWERMDREMRPIHTATIGVDLSVSGDQKPQELLWRGAAAAALADILTQRGCNVEIVAFWSVEKMTSTVKRVVAKYMIKRSDMPLDLGSVSVSIAEIAFSRLVALYGLARHVPGKLRHSLGCCGSLPSQDQAGMDYVASQSVRNQQQAETWLKARAAMTEPAGV
jgi:hypothetical protein